MPITRRGATGPLLVPLSGIRSDGARRGPAAGDAAGAGRMHAAAASEFAVIAAPCRWALILRLPFFFPDTIDWDESTLIIMGQGIRDGFLPYDRIWDSKPPLAYAAYAGAIELLGHSVAALRVVGYLSRRPDVVPRLPNVRADRAGQARRLCRRARCSRHDVSAGAGAHDRASVRSAPFGYAASALQAATAVCLMHSLAGLLIGIAVMIRINLAVLAFAVGVLVVARPPLVPPARPLARGFAYAAGVLLIVVITVTPYLVSGRLPFWFDTVIRTGLEFSAHHRSFDNLLKLLQNAFGIRSDGSTRSPVLLLGALLWLGGLAGLLCCAGRWRQLPDQTTAMPSSPPPCFSPVRRWRWS